MECGTLSRGQPRGVAILALFIVSLSTTLSIVIQKRGTEQKVQSWEKVGFSGIERREKLRQSSGTVKICRNLVPQHTHTHTLQESEKWVRKIGEDEDKVCHSFARLVEGGREVGRGKQLVHGLALGRTHNVVI